MPMAVRANTAVAFDRNTLVRINTTHTLTSAFFGHVESTWNCASNILNIEPIALA